MNDDETADEYTSMGAGADESGGSGAAYGVSGSGDEYADCSIGVYSSDKAVGCPESCAGKCGIGSSGAESSNSG